MADYLATPSVDRILITNYEVSDFLGVSIIPPVISIPINSWPLDNIISVTISAPVATVSIPSWSFDSTIISADYTSVDITTFEATLHLGVVAYGSTSSATAISYTPDLYIEDGGGVIVYPIQFTVDLMGYNPHVFEIIPWTVRKDSILVLIG